MLIWAMQMTDFLLITATISGAFTTMTVAHGVDAATLPAAMFRSLLYGWCLAGCPLLARAWIRKRYDSVPLGVIFWSVNSMWAVVFLMSEVADEMNMAIFLLFIWYQLFAGIFASVHLVLDSVQWIWMRRWAGDVWLMSDWTNLVGSLTAVGVYILTLAILLTGDFGI